MPGAIHIPANFVRRRIVVRVRGVFNDHARGEQPVTRSDHALFPRDSVIWRVHGDVTTMMVGGMSALLLQMLHPAALAGVLDHSNFRGDMLGRLRRTARFIALTTYGEQDAAEAAISRVKSIHESVHGHLADGTTYHASDPRLLAWVHVSEALSFLHAWRAYAEPSMTRSDQDRYFAEFARIARKLGAAPVPDTRVQALALIDQMRPELYASRECKDVARLILTQRLSAITTSTAQQLMAQSAVDLLPAWARAQLGLQKSRLSAGLVHAATFGMAATLRWAFSRAA